MSFKDKQSPSTPAQAPEGERIAKVLSRRGIASRREAERLIEMGEVKVNGKTITSPALNVTDADRITISGEPLPEKQPARMWLYYKPEGLVNTNADEKGRDTIFDHLPEDMPRVMSVGRLDLTSEGLLLLTNDGELKRRLELPSTGWLRKYRVRVNGEPYDDMLQPLRDGITIDGEHFAPMQVTMDRQQGSNAWLTVGLREGKNREIRRAMNAVGLFVNRLIRVSYGPFRLNDLQPGQVEEVRQKVLRDQIGDIMDRPEGAEDKRESKRLARNDAADASKSLRRAPRSSVPAMSPLTPRAKAPALPGRARKIEDDLTQSAPRYGRDEGRGQGRGESRGYSERPSYTRSDRAEPRSDRGGYDKKPYAARSETSRGDRPYGSRSDAPRGDKPYGARSEDKRGFSSDRPASKPFASRGDKPFGARSETSRGDRPYGSRSDAPRSDKPYGARSEDKRGFSPDRPASKPFASRGDKPFGARSETSRGDRPYTSRSDAPRSDKPYGARSEDKRGFSSDRPASKPFASRGDKPFGARSDKPRFDKPRSDKPSFDKPRGGGAPRGRKG